MADAIPLKLVDNGDGTAKLVQFATGETIPLDNLVAALKALGGLTPATGKLPYFSSATAASLATLSDKAIELLAKTTAADMLTLLGSAASGANKDITSLEGLTTALSIAQGGTGAKNGTDALNGLLGSQFSDQPTMRPSLLMDFINRSTLDARATFTRASIGTCYGPDGFLQTLAANAPRFDHDPVTRERKGLLVEESRTNLLTYSNELSHSYWNPLRLYTVPRAGLAPDGTWTATKITEDTSANTHQISQAVSVTAGATYTYSIYVKAAERSIVHIALGIAAFSTTQRVAFNLATLVATVQQGSPTYSITPAGNGWYRLTVTATAATTSTAYVYGYLCDATGSVSYTGDGVSGALWWGGQLEVGTFATSYIPTNATWSARAGTATYFNASGVLTTAASGVARAGYAYDGQRWVSAGLIAESAATNVVLYSQAFTNAKWVAGAGGAAAVTDNTTVAPDGTTTAATLSDPSTDILGIQQGLAITSSSSGQTASVFMKAGTSSISSVRLTLSGGTSVVGELVVNLANGAAIWRGGVAGATYQVQSLSGGWWRVSLTVIDNNTGNTNANLEIRPAWATTMKDVFESSATGTIAVWGAQLEVGYYATSYIPTTSTTVTRVADTASSATATRAEEGLTIPLDSWFNQREGTLVIHASKPLASFTNNQFFFALGSASTRVLADYTNAARAVGYMGVTSTTPSVDPTAWRYGLSWDYAGGTKVSLNGSTAGAGTYIRATMSQFYIGQSYTTTPGAFGRHNGHIRHIRYFPKQVTDLELQALAA